MSHGNLNHWSRDREAVLHRVISAPRDRVYAAWTTTDIGEWFGPAGFTCTTHEMNFSLGGVWRFDLTAPDGEVYPNKVVYLEIEPEKLLVFDHGSGTDDDPDRFRVTVTFDEQRDGKTVLTMRQLHQSAEQRDATIGWGAVELGGQTLSKLADSVET